VVVGDFPQDEAKLFFTEYALPEVGLQGYKLSDSDWQAIYEVWLCIHVHTFLDAGIIFSFMAYYGLQVCGGNAALLKSLADAAENVQGKVAWDESKITFLHLALRHSIEAQQTKTG